MRFIEAIAIMKENYVIKSKYSNSMYGEEFWSMTKKEDWIFQTKRNSIIRERKTIQLSDMMADDWEVVGPRKEEEWNKDTTSNSGGNNYDRSR